MSHSHGDFKKDTVEPEVTHHFQQRLFFPVKQHNATSPGIKTIAHPCFVTENLLAYIVNIGPKNKSCVAIHDLEKGPLKDPKFGPLLEEKEDIKLLTSTRNGELITVTQTRVTRWSNLLKEKPQSNCVLEFKSIKQPIAINLRFDNQLFLYLYSRLSQQLQQIDLVTNKIKNEWELDRSYLPNILFDEHGNVLLLSENFKGIHVAVFNTTTGDIKEVDRPADCDLAVKVAVSAGRRVEVRGMNDREGISYCYDQFTRSPDSKFIIGYGKTLRDGNNRLHVMDVKDTETRELSKHYEFEETYRTRNASLSGKVDLLWNPWNNKLLLQNNYLNYIDFGIAPQNKITRELLQCYGIAPLAHLTLSYLFNFHPNKEFYYQAPSTPKLKVAETFKDLWVAFLDVAKSKNSRTNRCCENLIEFLSSDHVTPQDLQSILNTSFKHYSTTKLGWTVLLDVIDFYLNIHLANLSYVHKGITQRATEGRAGNMFIYLNNLIEKIPDVDGESKSSVVLEQGYFDLLKNLFTWQYACFKKLIHKIPINKLQFDQKIKEEFIALLPKFVQPKKISFSMRIFGDAKSHETTDTSVEIFFTIGSCQDLKKMLYDYVMINLVEPLDKKLEKISEGMLLKENFYVYTKNSSLSITEYFLTKIQSICDQLKDQEPGLARRLKTLKETILEIQKLDDSKEFFQSYFAYYKQEPSQTIAPRVGALTGC